MHQFITARVLRAMGVPLPQQKFIAHLFSLWFCVRGRFNFTNLSRYSYFHERTFRRGFAQDFNWLDFNRRLLTIMIPPCNQLIAAMDASFITKSGKHSPQLGWFFNGCASRVEKGLEASTIAILDVTLNTAYGLSARQTPAIRTPKNFPGKKKQKTSKEARWRIPSRFLFAASLRGAALFPGFGAAFGR